MNILIAEDDDATRKGIAAFLEGEGHEVKCAADGREAYQYFQKGRFDLVISDVKMPEMTGLELLAHIQTSPHPVPMMMMTAFATVEEAVQAMQRGAEDYLTKPLNLDELLIKIQRIGSKIELLNENRHLRNRLKHLEFPEMIGTSKAHTEIQKSIQRLENDADVSVLITGESGTGKELVARTIHAQSRRNTNPFVAVNCAAFSDALLESELFGHRKGAFTGAYRDKVGLFQAANKGTLFFDEVSEMSTRMQSKLLRALQEQTFMPVGDTQTIHVDVRIISASNKHLGQLMKKGTFREDLYYRLNVVEIIIPPLRERPGDISILIKHFLEKYNPKRALPLHISKPVYDTLESYPWPGNVRELENLVRGLIATCETPEVRHSDLPDKIMQAVEGRANDWEGRFDEHDYKSALNHVVHDFETAFLQHHLKKHDGNISKCSESIGLSRVALHKKIKQYGITVNLD